MSMQAQTGNGLCRHKQLQISEKGAEQENGKVKSFI